MPALAGAPRVSIRPVPRGQVPEPAPPPDIASLIDAARLGGDVSFFVADAATGAVLEEYQSTRRMPPASVAKAVTALYALDRLGPGFRFATSLVAMGPVTGGRLLGDLALVGSGDPTLDTDSLATLAEGLKAAGVFEVTGSLRLFSTALPNLRWIDSDQPDHVGYNPSISGLNLNFNRVHFEWQRQRSSYEMTMQARDLKYRPSVSVAQMAIEDRMFPVFTYSSDAGIDLWTVAQGALGRNGARWLPVRNPSAYVSEVFQSLARSHGIALKPGEPLEEMPQGETLAEHLSDPLEEMLADMLKYSVNLSAEVFGLTSTQVGGDAPNSLIASARQMNLWARRELGAKTPGLIDHSGLGYGSRLSPRDMVTILASGGADGLLPGMLKPFGLGENARAEARAKTGTLNFVSTLAGFVSVPGGPDLIFAIFTADTERRDAVSVENRESPPGARSWDRRSRTLQRNLINRWVSLVTG